MFINVCVCVCVCVCDLPAYVCACMCLCVYVLYHGDILMVMMVLDIFCVKHPYRHLCL